MFSCGSVCWEYVAAGGFGECSLPVLHINTARTAAADNPTAENFRIRGSKVDVEDNDSGAIAFLLSVSRRISRISPRDNNGGCSWATAVLCSISAKDVVVGFIMVKVIRCLFP